MSLESRDKSFEKAKILSQRSKKRNRKKTREKNEVSFLRNPLTVHQMYHEVPETPSAHRNN